MPRCGSGEGVERASADFLRAAVFRWITPRLTARSSVRMASRTLAFESGDFVERAVRAAFTEERIALRAARFR
jgi:hypothetical protein